MGRSGAVAVEDMQQLEQWAGALLAKLAPGERRRVTLAIARDMRRSQRARIAAQQNPDGKPFAPRKRVDGGRDKSGRIKRRRLKMFRRISKTDYLRAQGTESEAIVGFFGRVGRIARVHQEGLTDEVKPGGPRVRYERRQLLGFTDADLERIRNLLIEHLAK